MDAIITIDDQQRIVQFNPAAGLMFHCKISEALGTSLDRLIPERFRHVHKKHVRTFAGSQAVNRRMGALNQIVGLRSDGTEFPAEATISQVEVGGKKLMTVVIRDITERQLVLNALESVTQQTQQILNSVGEGINGMDREGKITFINPVGAAMIGRTVDEVIGQDRHEIFHHSHEDGTPYLVEECPVYVSLHDGVVHRVDTEVFWHKDGTSFPVEYVSTPIRNQKGCITGAVVSFRDITDRKRAETFATRQKTILEMIGAESSLPDILRQICLMVEEQAPDSLSSILICHGLNLYVGDGPNLPDAYLKAIDGIQMGPEVGSCGTAAHRKQRVVVSDIAKDPLWKDYHKIALQHGLHACWSTPILSSQQKILGVLGLYHKTIRTPQPKDVELLDIAAHLGGIAIERTRVQEELHGHREQLQGLTAQLLTAQEEERRRISRDLHDDVNQRLAVLALKIQTAQKGIAESDPSHKDLQDLYDGVADLSDDVRHLAYQLHPSVLDDLGLKLAVQALSNDFSKWEGIPISFTSHNVPAVLSQEVATCMYRFIQEALRNIAKHAQASEVQIGLGVSNNALHLSVKDNGIGFDPNADPAQKGLGLLSMKERIRLQHGTLTITSQPKKGTEIFAWLPLPNEVL
jgi:PAS domain S-box-containing protein